MSTTLDAPLDHEELVMKSGARTGLPIVVGLHSTVLGPAVGGLRLAGYDSAQDAIADCLRLSAGMTFKAAAVDNGTGGGKAVVPFLHGTRPQDLTPQRHEALLLDVAEVVGGLGGRFHVAPDVGTGTSEMQVIRRVIPWVGGYSAPVDGRGVTTHGTGIGVHQAMRAAVATRWGSQDLRGRLVTIVGFGGVGQWLTELLIRDGARVEVTDIDTSLYERAYQLGAAWVPLEGAYERQTDILAPCALGGVITADLVSKLQTTVIVGSANNQLATDDVAQQLADAGVLWAPDFIANAGGVMYGTGIELHHLDHDTATERLDLIAHRLRHVFERTGERGNTLNEAHRIATERLHAAGTHR